MWSIAFAPGRRSLLPRSYFDFAFNLKAPFFGWRRGGGGAGLNRNASLPRGRFQIQCCSFVNLNCKRFYSYLASFNSGKWYFQCTSRHLHLCDYTLEAKPQEYHYGGIQFNLKNFVNGWGKCIRTFVCF